MAIAAQENRVLMSDGTRNRCKLVEHFVSPCQAKPLVDGKVEADKTAVRTVLDAG